MPDPESTPLRGDALWRARKAEIAARNDAAQKAGAARREAADAKDARRRAAADRREADNLPVQPEP